MRLAEEFTAALGHDRVWLHANKRFAENVQLYLRLGDSVDPRKTSAGKPSGST